MNFTINENMKINLAILFYLGLAIGLPVGYGLSILGAPLAVVLMPLTVPGIAVVTVVAAGFATLAVVTAYEKITGRGRA